MPSVFCQCAGVDLNLLEQTFEKGLRIRWEVAGVGVFSDSVEVACSPSGQPLQLVWQNRTYKIAAEPLRWYERRKWWEEELRAERGRGAGLVDHEIWRVQARINDRSELRTLDIVHQVDTGRWRLLKIHDAVRDLSA